ncbi:MAG: proline--tRNA ligase [Verrucomicrobiales bacterium]|jgi:prolyl-tRNA synthetase|nr:proline--tRNA ligase [Verrucomicrobiales bacterium]
MAKPQNAISPSRQEDFPEWYQQVVRAADLAENSEVRGCMVIKPWGYGLWEQIQSQLDAMFKATGHKNAYFPLLIPLSYLEKEAEHAEGFATECAVVTHHRLEAQKDESGKTKMVPTGELAEPFIIRPTSETIIGAAFARWIESYRDLPLLINQWANVMRWEMRPRLFLRTAEFLWQEGHTVHETSDEAWEETEKILDIYEEFAREHLAIPVITGEKTENERFPGADRTLCIEAMVQDKKAIQAGTSHFLGQNFSKASDISFAGRDGTKQFGWTTSWGVSTRLVGTLIMAHGDDDGVIIPPMVAPIQVVILPVIPKEENREAVITAAESMAKSLSSSSYAGLPIRVEIDKRDMQGGAKNWEWIKKGAPIRVEIGPRDIEKGTIAVTRRDRSPKDKEFIPNEEFLQGAANVLEDIQSSLLERATRFKEDNMKRIDSMEEFIEFFTPSNTEKPEIHGGFALCHWAGSNEEEEKIAKEHKVTIRCIPHGEQYVEEGTCILTGQPSSRRVVFSKAY